MERYLASLWASCEHVLEFGIPMGSFFFNNFGIRMGPNSWLGRHTPTHFQRKTPSPCFRVWYPNGLVFFNNFGIRMGPNSWLGRHTPTHFQRKTPGSLSLAAIKFTIPIFRLACSKFCYSRLLSLYIFYRYLLTFFWLVCYCSLWLYLRYLESL